MRPLRPDPDHYLNESGLLVFTAQYLFDRGHCCGNGCRHCPYDYEAVPDAERAALREARLRRGPERFDNFEAHD